MSGAVRIVPLEACHVGIAPFLRSDDLDEIMAYGSWESAEACIEYSISMTDIGWAGLCDDGIIAIGGAGGAGALDGRTGVVWLLSSVLADRYPVSFGKYTRALFGDLKRHYDVLVNYTDARYTKALRWLEWLGFEIKPPESFGPEGHRFCLVRWERS
jgi:hypothetical protein